MKTIVTVGTSTGGLSALRELVAGLPADLAAPVCVAQHVGANVTRLPGLLAPHSKLPVRHPADGERLAPGHIYVAVPDHHMMVVDGHLHLLRGPRENHARPAIDPLFRSAAEQYGRGAIGVLLQGRLNDGTAGLYEIKRRGGVAVVQDPATADYPDMPRSAINHVDVDHVVAVAEMGPLLGRLSEELVSRDGPGGEVGEIHPDRRFAKPVAFACPECGGALRHERVGSLEVYTCHTRHTMTAEVLASLQGLEFERSLECAIRLSHEQAALAREVLGTADMDEREREAWREIERTAEERICALGAIAPGHRDAMPEACERRTRRG